jgi:hypothetical protein
VLNAVVVEIGRYRAAKRAEEIASDIIDEQPEAAPQRQGGRIRTAATKIASRRAARKTPAPPG